MQVEVQQEALLLIREIQVEDLRQRTAHQRLVSHSPQLNTTWLRRIRLCSSNRQIHRSEHLLQSSTECRVANFASSFSVACFHTIASVCSAETGQQALRPNARLKVHITALACQGEVEPTQQPTHHWTVTLVSSGPSSRSCLFGTVYRYPTPLGATRTLSGASHLIRLCSHSEEWLLRSQSLRSKRAVWLFFLPMGNGSPPLPLTRHSTALPACFLPSPDKR